MSIRLNFSKFFVENVVVLTTLLLNKLLNSFCNLARAKERILQTLNIETTYSCQETYLQTLSKLNYFIRFLRYRKIWYKRRIFDLRDILTPKNNEDLINELVSKNFPGTTYSKLSVDCVLSEKDIEFLNTISATGLPPHKLELKNTSPSYYSHGQLYMAISRVRLLKICLRSLIK